jgi:hypothetical protein
MELLSGQEKIITKSEISLNAGTLHRGFTVHGLILREVLYRESLDLQEYLITKNVIVVECEGKVCGQRANTDTNTYLFLKSV